MLKPEKIIIATNNKSKENEIRVFLNSLKIDLIPLKYFTDSEPKENGRTFKENALIKARNAYKKSSIASLADDSGLCIKSLNYKPGIYSSRWAGPKKLYSKAFDKIKNELIKLNLPIQNQEAYFICVLAYINKLGEEYIFEGKAHGKIIFPPKGKMGFGYDSIFIPNGLSKTFAEIEINKKNKLSHRKVAFDSFLESIYEK